LDGGVVVVVEELDGVVVVEVDGVVELEGSNMSESDMEVVGILI
jgi:hypothetical protein